MSSQYVVTEGAKREVGYVSRIEEWVVMGSDEIQIILRTICQILYYVLPHLLPLLHDHNRLVCSILLTNVQGNKVVVPRT